MTAAPGPHCSPDVVTFGETRAALRLGKAGAGGDAVMTSVNQSPPDMVTFGETVAALWAQGALRLGKAAAGEEL